MQKNEENTRSIEEEGELGCVYVCMYIVCIVLNVYYCIIGKALFICSFKENSSKLRRPAPISMNAFAFCE